MQCNCRKSTSSISDLIPTRVAIGVMLLLAMIMLFAMRTNMSLTILAMVQPPMLQNATMHALPDVRLNTACVAIAPID